MGGDYTRFTHKPSNRYEGVLTQQGRPQLDAEWNEQWEIAARRWRNQAQDIMGPCAVPEATTADAFLITPSGTDLAIDTGRLYVDGLLAEILPEESYFYTKQPYYWPKTLQTMTGGPNGLVYLDVWQREITHVEDPELLEKALHGVDTTTRVQTVWQVKIDPTGSSAADCKANLKNRLPASGGRLSSRPNAPAKSSDPCASSPSGGYRGLENRLYRVEIHDITGQKVRFKWSRDNGAVVAAVQEITKTTNASQLKVSHLGRDQVCCFKKGDWVEITDERRVLTEEPGEMACITNIDEANNIITLDRDILKTAGAFDLTDPTRHTRVRRWDQKKDIDIDGLLSVLTPAKWHELENGVEIKLETTVGSTFHVGDYWVFAARTVDGSVEKLDKAKPQGIHHHYCALATLSGIGSASLKVEDCRILWPPKPSKPQEGCCNVIVHPGDDIQGAIDSLPPEGGCVCLKTGVYQINSPIQINRSNVVLCGESPGTSIQSSIANLLEISGVRHVTVEGIHFIGGQEQIRHAVTIKESRHVVIQNNLIEDCGIKVSRDVSNLRIRLNNIQVQNINGSYAVSSEGDLCWISDNYIVLAEQNTYGVSVTGNDVSVTGNILHSTIENGTAIGLHLTGQLEISSFNGMVCQNIFRGSQHAIVVKNRTSILVADNHIEKGNWSIHLEDCVHSQVLRNHISNSEEGISISNNQFPKVSDNRLDEIEGPGISGAELKSLLLTHNRLAHCGYSKAGTGIDVQLNEGELCIESCEVLDTGLSLSGDAYQGAVLGIKASVVSCRITNNRVVSSEPDQLIERRFGALELTSQQKDYALVNNNVFSGAGRCHLIEFKDGEAQGFDKVIFNNNYCEHFGGAEDRALAIAVLTGRHLIVIGNHVKAARGVWAMDLKSPVALTLMGNITTGDCRNLGGSSLPGAYRDFNAVNV
jgi:parallel beta-helix repeat protein